jgi:hypothetical protein
MYVYWRTCVCMYRLAYMCHCIRNNPTAIDKNLGTKCILRAKCVAVYDCISL